MKSIDQQSSNGNPANAQRHVVASDNSNGGDDDRPPRRPILPLSHFALRDDGALLVSLEDAANRDLTGREVLAFLVLSPEETALARVAADNAFSDTAAYIIGRLPMRPK